MKIASVLLLALLSGCATCERHPTGCAIAGTLIAGAVVVSVAGMQWHDSTIPRPFPRTHQ